MNTSTPVRLFGQFKQNGNGFSNFGQLSTNGDNSSSSTPSYFTSTLSKISTTNGSGGFGSSSTSLAASLAPLTSKYKIMRFLFFFIKKINDYFLVNLYLVNPVHLQILKPIKMMIKKKKKRKMRKKKMIMMMKIIKQNLHYSKQQLNMKLNEQQLIQQLIFKVIHQQVKNMK